MTRRRRVRERIRRNYWRRRRPRLEYDIASLEIRIGGVLLDPSGYAVDSDLLLGDDPLLRDEVEP